MGLLSDEQARAPDVGRTADQPAVGAHFTAGGRGEPGEVVECRRLGLRGRDRRGALPRLAGDAHQGRQAELVAGDVVWCGRGDLLGRRVRGDRHAGCAERRRQHRRTPRRPPAAAAVPGRAATGRMPSGSRSCAVASTARTGRSSCPTAITDTRATAMPTAPLITRPLVAAMRRLSAIVVLAFPCAVGTRASGSPGPVRLAGCARWAASAACSASRSSAASDSAANREFDRFLRLGFRLLLRPARRGSAAEPVQRAAGRSCAGAPRRRASMRPSGWREAVRSRRPVPGRAARVSTSAAPGSWAPAGRPRPRSARACRGRWGRRARGRRSSRGTWPPGRSSTRPAGDTRLVEFRGGRREEDELHAERPTRISLGSRPPCDTRLAARTATSSSSSVSAVFVDTRVDWLSRVSPIPSTTRAEIPPSGWGVRVRVRSDGSADAAAVT